MKFNQQQITELVNSLNAQSTGWSFTEGKLSKEFKFKDFIHAFAFMSKCAIYAEKINHHPQWFNVYNKVNVQLLTHDVDGISELDEKFAKKMDEYASA